MRSITTKPKLACDAGLARLGTSAGTDSSAPLTAKSGSPWNCPPPVTFPSEDDAQVFVAVAQVRGSSKSGRATSGDRSGKHAWMVSVPGVPLLVYVHDTWPLAAVVHLDGEHVPVFGWLVWPMFGPAITSNSTATPGPTDGCPSVSLVATVAVTV
jgi:hypothetical protein